MSTPPSLARHATRVVVTGIGAITPLGNSVRDTWRAMLANRLDPMCLYALAATDEALRDARLDPDTLPDATRTEIGVVFGTGIGGLQTFQNQSEAFWKSGPTKVSPFFIPMMIPDMAPGIISIHYGFRGPNHCVVSACATGNHSIGDGLSLIREGHAEIVVCGGR